jgi:hypothetical protein
VGNGKDWSPRPETILGLLKEVNSRYSRSPGPAVLDLVWSEKIRAWVATLGNCSIHNGQSFCSNDTASGRTPKEAVERLVKFLRGKDICRFDMIPAVPIPKNLCVGDEVAFA